MGMKLPKLPSPVKIDHSKFSFRKRLGLVTLAIFQVYFIGGIIYGWPSVREMLVKDNLYQSRCSPGDEISGGTCTSQELLLGVSFTIGSWVTQGGRLFGGPFVDAFSIRVQTAVYSAIAALGAVLIGIASESMHSLLPGMIFIGLGGPLLQMIVQNASVLFPLHSSLVMATMSGAFMASTSVFLIIKSIFDNSDLSRETLFVGYAILIMIQGAAGALFWPSGKFFRNETASNQTDMHEVKSSSQEAKRPDSAVSQTHSAPQAVHQETSRGIQGNIRAMGFKHQLFSGEMIGITFYFSILVIEAQFFIGSLAKQIAFIDDTAVSSLTFFFNLVLALSAITTPLLGIALDSTGFGPAGFIISSMFVLHGALLLVESTPAFYASAIFYCLGRPNLFGYFFAYNSRTFGFAHYGILVGVGSMASALASLLQYLFLDVALESGSFFGVNVACLLLSIVSFAFPLWVYSRRENGNLCPFSPSFSNKTAPPRQKTSTKLNATKEANKTEEVQPSGASSAESVSSPSGESEHVPNSEPRKSNSHDATEGTASAFV